MNINNVVTIPVWTDEYEIGVKSIDGQHKHLFELLSDFHQLMQVGSFKSEELRGVLKKLLEYAATHFFEEEMHMLISNMDNESFNIHIEQHKYFVNEVNNLSMFIDDDAFFVAPLIYEFVTQWLIEHIIKVDSLIRRY